MSKVEKPRNQAKLKIDRRPPKLEPCLICQEVLDTFQYYQCGHSPVCLKCFLTLIKCYNDRLCPLCQADSISDPIVSNTQSSYTELLPISVHDQDQKVFFADQPVRDKFNTLLTYVCPECNAKFNTVKKFTNHIFQSHQLHTCKYCTNSRKFLPSSIPVFKKVQQHNIIHPVCSCCNLRCFDDHELAEHYRTNHFRCDICFEPHWFKTIDELVEHNRVTHLCCCYEGCIAAFKTQLELHMHLVQDHGEESSPLPLSLSSAEKAADSADERILRENRRKKLRKSCMRAFHNDATKTNAIFSLIDKLSSHKLTIPKFLQKYNSLADKWKDGLFCDVAAAVPQASLRAELVKVRQNYRPCKLPGVRLTVDEVFPTFESVMAPKPAVMSKSLPPPPAEPLSTAAVDVQQKTNPQKSGDPRRKGRGKKIILGEM